MIFMMIKFSSFILVLIINLFSIYIIFVIIILNLKLYNLKYIADSNYNI